jgi:cell division protein FtsN
MKWFFSTLLIANLGMFIWLYPQQDMASDGSAVPDDVGKLRLVSEETESDRPSADNVLGAYAVEDESPLNTDQPVSAEPSRVPPMVVTSDQAASQVSAQAAPEENRPAPQPSPICGTLGVFDKRSQAELVSVRLLAKGGKTEITAESSNDQAGYWVLIPPQQNRAGAISIAKRLEEAGVSDLWRFTSGELAHAISLGLFRDRERAQARSNKINAMGFDSEVRPRFREKTRYWLNYRYQESASFQDSTWRELQASFPGIERNEGPCP